MKYLLLLLLFIGCSQVEPIDEAVLPTPAEKPPAQIECSSDLDCTTAGCSSQICTTAKEASDLVTTCEFRDEYQCLRLSSCSCIKGKCGWVDTEAYLTCLENLPKLKGGNIVY